MRLLIRRGLVASTLGLLSLAGAACGDGGGSSPDGAADVDMAVPPKAFSYLLDGQLRLDHAQVKSSHNSYHVETTEGGVLPWNYTHAPLDVQLGSQGVRHFELDLNYDPEFGVEVYHVPGADEGTTCRRFVDCLRTVKAWSDRYPGHLPIGIQVEAKTGFGGATLDAAIAAVEADIRAVFPSDRILTPDLVRGASPSLGQAVAERGWPTLGVGRGRVYFAWDEAGDLRRRYTGGGVGLEGRLLFVDSDPGDPYAAYAVINDPIAGAAEIASALAAHLLVRTRADSDGDQARENDTTQRDAALAAGAHFVSTDFPATMNGLPYVVEIPGGAPARCNPKTAPQPCTSLALEDPAFVGGL